MATLMFMLLLAMFCIVTFEFSWQVETFKLNCIEKERFALLKFKRSLTDPSDRLRSWVGEDCCSWEGVGCDNRTGHVVKLDLRNPHPFDVHHYDRYTGYDATYSKACLVGKELDSALLQLKHLKHLDLSSNNFSRSMIPRFLGSFHELRYLNLSSAWFNGKVPHELGNISTLQSLDLNSNYAYQGNIYSAVELWSNSLHWLSHLSSLRYLDMSNVNLSQASDWHHMTNYLPSLSELDLSECGLHQNFPSFFRFNLTRLTVLRLAYNYLQGEIPHALCNITSLEVLDLSGNGFVSPIPSWLIGFNNLVHLNLEGNEFSGQIPNVFGNSSSLVGFKAIGQLKNLQYLFLGYNLFSGPIPKYLGSLSSLRVLELSRNQLNGTIPKSIGQLSELIELSLSGNLLEGLVTEDHFVKLSNLEALDMRGNPLAVKVGPHWVPPFQLSYLLMSSCKLGPKFPTWLRTQYKLFTLDLSNTNISVSIPNWFGNQTSNLTYLNLSHNQIGGRVPKSFTKSSTEKVYILLGSNKLEGTLPNFSTNVIVLDLHNNSISGPLPHNLGDMMPALQKLDLSSNLINGSVPSSVCAMKNLEVLDISKNHLSGYLPKCWTELRKLKALRLASNNLSGAIANSTGHLHSLKFLHLNNNSFHGEIPLALKNSTDLLVLDLGENRLSGNIPIWIGEDLSVLQILKLRSNMFHNEIPLHLCGIRSLHILDLAENNLSGNIPLCLCNINGMIMGQAAYIGSISEYDFVGFQDEVVQTMKGMELVYDSYKVLSLLVNLDLSSNNLDGIIPKELTSLTGLIGLNLSRNHLTGSIPNEIGHLSSLESFDLSYNNLSGPIPQSMSNLTSLSRLNLSYNTLSGKIPSGSQLQALDDPSSIYIGNTELCGDAVGKKCRGEESSQAGDVNRTTGRNGSTLSGLYISIASGFIIGFWGVCFSLIFKKSWRYAYFRFVDNTLALKTYCTRW